MSGNVTSQLPSPSRRILATTRSFIDQFSAAIAFGGTAPSRAHSPEASRQVGPGRDAPALWFCICRHRIQSSCDSLAGGRGRACILPAESSEESAGLSSVHRSRQVYQFNQSASSTEV